MWNLFCVGLSNHLLLSLCFSLQCHSCFSDDPEIFMSKVLMKMLSSVSDVNCLPSFNDIILLAGEACLLSRLAKSS